MNLPSLETQGIVPCWKNVICNKNCVMLQKNQISREVAYFYLICFQTKILVTFKKFASGFISKWTGQYVPMYWHNTRRAYN